MTEQPKPKPKRLRLSLEARAARAREEADRLAAEAANARMARVNAFGEQATRLIEAVKDDEAARAALREVGKRVMAS